MTTSTLPAGPPAAPAPVPVAPTDPSEVGAPPARRSLRRNGSVTAERRARWELGALAALLVATAVMYLWDLSASGWANSYYAAAVQAGTQSWKALLFGSLDAGNAITVDKPPASLWVMGLSGRIFGFSSWSMLAPQALMGVGSVALLSSTVRRWSGSVAGLLAGAALALTPVAALMFKFNNPDALLTLLLVAGAYCLTRALDAAARRAGTLWIALAGTAIGFGFLTKMMQAFLVLPAFALVYLICAPTTLRRRIGQSLTALAAVVVSGGWFVALVELWPASARPYIGGSTTNSLLELALGYNGLSRITGSTTAGGGGAGGNSSSAFGGATGLGRLFSDDMGIDVSWLLPSALIALVLGLWVTRRAPRTDRTLAGLLLWGGWLLVTGLVLSYMSGIVHPYYTAALAPSVVAVLAIGGRALWLQRQTWTGRAGLAALVASSGVWSYVLLARNASWHPELRYAIVAVALLSAAGLLVPAERFSQRFGQRLGKGAAVAVLSAGLVAGLAGPGAYTLATAATSHNGSIPSVGPAGASSGMGGGPGGGGFGPQGSAGGPPSGTMPTGGNGPTGTTGSTSTGTTGTNGPTGTTGGTGTTGSTSQGTQNGPGARGGGQGGEASSALVALLKASTTQWAAAVSGAQSAASLELASGTSVIGIGGFSNSDPAPTLAQFQQWVSQGLIHYYISGGQGGSGGPGGGSSSSASEISTWVSAHYTATTVGSSTVYDLTKAATS